MIGKTMIGRSFAGCVNYNISKVEKGFGEILECRGVRDFSRKEMIRDFNIRKSTNPKLSKCVWHTALSFQDKLTSNQMLSIARSWMKGMDLDETQYVILRHTDTNHHHVHIIANRINDDCKTISDSHNWKKSEALCKELVQKYQLTPVSEERNENRIDRSKLKGRDLLKTDINRVIRQILLTSKNLEDFSLQMKVKGFNSSIRYNPDQSVRGISFERDGVKIKASDIHKSLSAKNIMQMIQSSPVQNKAWVKTDQPESSIRPGLMPSLSKLGKSLSPSDEEDEQKKKRRRDRGLEI
jgi:hypothetical protein